MPRNSSILFRAVRETASKELSYPCQYCPRTFHSESTRNIHVALLPACKAAAKAYDERRRLGFTTDLLDPSLLSQRTTVPPPLTATPARTKTPPPLVEPPCLDSRPPNGPSSPESSSQAGQRKFPKPWVEEIEDEESPQSRSGWDEHSQCYVDPFPNPNAGAPISDDCTYQFNVHTCNRGSSALDDPDHFEMAELLMTTGLSGADRDRFLQSKLLRGRTPWENSYQLLGDIDRLPHGPGWEVHEIAVDEGNVVSKHLVYGRDIIQIVRDLIGNPEWKDQMRYAPELHSTDRDRNVRVYGEMWTARWWWRTQMLMAKKGRVTLAPLIAASDRTTVAMLLNGQQVYPVYVTIGNIGKATRRKPTEHATVLLGYLPVEKFKHITNAKERARLRAELLHRSMEALMAPLKAASKDGVEMWCADGRLRRVYPLLAAFVGDWPEQNDMACTNEGGCPVCMTANKGRGTYREEWPMRYGEDTVAAWDKYDEEGGSVPLEDLGTRPCRPWWADLTPDINFHACITPDLLHQLHQGIFKTHLKKWIAKLVGQGTLDDCYRAMPTTQGMRHFSKGVSTVKNWTGKESKQMASQLLPVVAGQADSAVELLARATLDFIHRAHALRMTELDIQELQAALQLFHDAKEVLVELGLYESIDAFDRIPKVHMVGHYPRSIRELGTPDGYNTELPESLHIALAKMPWRRSNKVNATPQMAKLLQRLEAIRRQRTYLNKRFGLQQDRNTGQRDEWNEGSEWNWDEGMDEEPDQDGENVVGEPGAEHVADGPLPHIGLAKVASKDEPGWEFVNAHKVGDLLTVIKSYARRRLGVKYDSNQLTLQHRFKIWHRFYLHHRPLRCAPNDPPACDVIRGRPATNSSPHGRSAFDTVLFTHRPEAFGIHRYRAGRVRAIFALPEHMQSLIPGVLVYLELFTPFNITPSVFHQLHATSPARIDGKRVTTIVPITDVVLGCHLVPEFRYLVETYHLTAQTDSLALGKRFHLNHYANYYIFQLMECWRRQQKANRALGSNLRNAVSILKRS